MCQDAACEAIEENAEDLTEEGSDGNEDEEMQEERKKQIAVLEKERVRQKHSFDFLHRHHYLGSILFVFPFGSFKPFFKSSSHPVSITAFYLNT